MARKIEWRKLLNILPMAILLIAAAPVLILLNALMWAVHMVTNPRENASERIMRQEIEQLPRRPTEAEVESLRRTFGARRRMISHWRNSGLLL